jgi:hypothetical protein
MFGTVVVLLGVLLVITWWQHGILSNIFRALSGKLQVKGA